MRIEFDLQLVSEMNARGHWGRRKRRFDMQAETVAWEIVTRVHPDDIPEPPCVVTLTRIAPREFDDDNLRSAFKAVRDAVAEWIGADDGKRGGIEWRYKQERGAPRQHRVRIEWSETRST